jgi:hypothetical protein
MANSKKLHWYVVSHWNKWLKFISSEWDVMYWAWGNENSPNFVLQALVAKYGKSEAKEIYEKFNIALLNVDRLPIEKPRKHTACLVSYHKTNDNQDWQIWQQTPWADEEIHSKE